MKACVIATTLYILSANALRISSSDFAIAWTDNDVCKHDDPEFRKCLGELTHAFGAGDQIQRCQTRSKRFEPSPQQQKYTMQDIANMARNRSIIFVGDSIGAHSMQYLTCALQSFTDAGTYEVRLDDYHGQFHNTVYFPNLNTRLEVKEHGKWRDLHHPTYDLKREMPQLLETLGPRDVLQINVGVHYNSGTDAKEIEAVASALAAAAAKSHGIILWRETTPQHFASPFGLWNRKTTPCRPLSKADLESSDIRYRNTIANAIVAPAGIPVVRIFEDMLPLFSEHCEPKDCTHWSLDLYRFLIDRLFMAIDSVDNNLVVQVPHDSGLAESFAH